MAIPNVRVVIVRGIPGSGKSMLANLLAELSFIPCEADMYPEFWETGKYYFKPDCIAKAHEWCFEQFKSVLEQGGNVCVANTFVNLHHMEPYISYCKEHNIAYHIVVSDMRFNSIHRVPATTLRRMIDNFEFAPWQDALTNARKQRAERAVVNSDEAVNQ